MKLEHLIRIVIVVGTSVCLLLSSVPLQAFNYATFGGLAERLDDAPLRLTRNKCTIDLPEEYNAYMAGIEEWNSMRNVEQLFSARFFSTGCSVRKRDESSEVALVKSAAIDGHIGLAVKSRRLRNGAWTTIEADILITRDGGRGVVPFRVGTRDLDSPPPRDPPDPLDPPDPREWVPESNAEDPFGTYLHELGHAVGLAHDSGEQANLMTAKGRLPRVGDSRPRFPVWAAVLPDERAGARQEYSTDGFDINWSASAQYFAPHLGFDFITKAEDVTDTDFTESFYHGAMNWRSAVNRDHDGDQFADVFASTFLGASNELDEFTVKACAGESLALPYSMAYSGAGILDNGLCHSFSLVRNDRIDGRHLGRSGECGLTVRGGFASGVMPVRLAHFLAPGTYRAFHTVDTCDPTVMPFCESVSHVDERDYDNTVETQIRIKVESHSENQDCPEDPLSVPLLTCCLTPLFPRVCSSNVDCVGLAESIEEDYRNERGVMWNSMLRDYECLPAVNSGDIGLGPTFTSMTCQCVPEDCPPVP